MALHADSSLNELSLEYSYAELQHATRNFDASHRLGSGSFGGVFRCVQRDGTEVAVKVLDLPEEAGFEEEVRVLSKFRHPNLVILMGFARHESQRLLVYELLAGGDVHRRLQKSCFEGVPFTWRQRVSAAFDASCGLSHLHHASPKVFHRDIKSANILLDRNGTAKMADFGLACLSHAGAKTHKVQQASGTVGYACPLYVQRGVVTEGSEVYSFGIVLLELLTASPPACVSQAQDGSQQYQFLVSHIAGSAQVAMSLADPKAQCPPQMQLALAELALRCTTIPEEHRPGFAEVVNTLRGLRDLPDSALGVLSGTPSAPPVVSGVSNAQPPVHPGFAAGHVQQGVVAGLAQPPQPPQQLQPQIGCPSPHGIAPHQQVVARHPSVLQSPSGCNQFSVQPQVVMSASPAANPGPQPALWALECVFADGGVAIGTDTSSRQRQRLVHRHQPGGQLLSTFRVGRMFQEDFFAALVPDADARSAVSREHFQIWAEELRDPGNSLLVGGIPCYFFLTNYSVNGTIVNGRHLQSRGEDAPLHSGDTIGLARLAPGSDGQILAPFLEFRFDLEGSILTDADPLPPSERPEKSLAGKPNVNSLPQDAARIHLPAHGAASAARSPVEIPTPSSASPASHARPHDVGTTTPSACTSFMGLGLEPMFVLEAGGTAVRAGLSPEHRRIVHGPPVRTGAEREPCAPLLLGRAQQQGFWQRLLIDEAFCALSRQHLQIEACEDQDVILFCVRNLSERNPIRVCGAIDDVDSAKAMEKDERRLLTHGDVIVVNPNRGNTLWLVFRNVLAGRGESGPAQATIVKPMPREVTPSADAGPGSNAAYS